MNFQAWLSASSVSCTACSVSQSWKYSNKPTIYLLPICCFEGLPLLFIVCEIFGHHFAHWRYKIKEAATKQPLIGPEKSVSAVTHLVTMAIENKATALEWTGISRPCQARFASVFFNHNHAILYSWHWYEVRIWTYRNIYIRCCPRAPFRTACNSFCTHQSSRNSYRDRTKSF